jgi:tetratricopeptide (TPR) repeat protein
MPARREPATGLAAAHFTRYQHAGDPDDLEAAVTFGREAAGLVAAGHVRAAGTLSNLSVVLSARFERFAAPPDLDEAIEACRAAAEATPADHPDRPGRLHRLGRMLIVRHERSGRAVDLDEILQVGAAVKRADRGIDLEWLAQAQWTAYARDHDRELLDEAIDTTRAVAARAEPDSDTLRMLSELLCVRFQDFGAADGLDEAVELARTAEARAADPASRRRAAASVVRALWTRFWHAGQRSDIDDAVELGRSESASPATHGEGDSELSMALGTALMLRFRSAGDIADLHEAIALGKAAIDAMPPEDRRRGVSASLVCGWLRNRYEQTGSLSDLSLAIDLGRASCRADREAGRLQVGLIALSNALTQRHLVDGNLADIDEGVETARAALATTPPAAPVYPTCLSNLGRALRLRSLERTGLGAVSDAFEAVGYGRAAVEAAAPADPERLRSLYNLVVSLLHRADLTSNVDDVEDAIATAREMVLGTPHRHPDYADRLRIWAEAHDDRFRLAGGDGYAHVAVDLYRQAEQAVTGPVPVRVAAARGRGSLAATMRRWPTALDGYSAAVALLPLVAWRGLDRPSSELQLTPWRGLSNDAAGCAVAAGEPETAVVLLEQSRAVLWSQMLDTRGDLGALRDAHPELAARLNDIRRRLMMIR